MGLESVGANLKEALNIKEGITILDQNRIEITETVETASKSVYLIMQHCRNH